MDGVQLNANNAVGVSENSRKEKIKTGLLIAGGVLLAGVSIFAAVQTKKLVNLKNTVRAGELQTEIQRLKDTIVRDKAFFSRRYELPSLSEELVRKHVIDMETRKLVDLENKLAKLTQKIG